MFIFVRDLFLWRLCYVVVVCEVVEMVFGFVVVIGLVYELFIGRG